MAVDNLGVLFGKMHTGIVADRLTDFLLGGISGLRLNRAIVSLIRDGLSILQPTSMVS